jgi:hypothetical protein
VKITITDRTIAGFTVVPKEEGKSQKSLSSQAFPFFLILLAVNLQARLCVMIGLH